MPFRTDKHYPSHNFDICELVDSYKKYIMKEIMYNVYQIHKINFIQQDGPRICGFYLQLRVCFALCSLC